MHIKLTCALILAILATEARAQPFYFGVDLSYVNQMQACGAIYRKDGAPINVYGLVTMGQTSLGSDYGIHRPGKIPLTRETGSVLMKMYVLLSSGQIQLGLMSCWIFIYQIPGRIRATR
jgi:hypothetical protein